MKQKIIVFGSYATDLSARCPVLPRPGETVKGSGFGQGHGGKGSNQAVAARRAGADLVFVTKLGEDAFGRQALEFYRGEGIGTEHIFIDPVRPTGCAMIFVEEGSGQNQIVISGGACEAFTSREAALTLPLLDECGLLLTQLETNSEPIEALLRAAREKGVFTVLDPAPARSVSEELLSCVDLITPNETEAEVLSGVRVESRENAALAARELMRRGVKNAVITMGSAGALLCTPQGEEWIPSVSCGAAEDTTGAGDAFTGAMAAALAEGCSLPDAARFGAAAAGIAVTRRGTASAMAFRHEIDRELSRAFPR